jgi:uncharacterized SAM-binding protein YcdF (DUF218 family)
MTAFLIDALKFMVLPPGLVLLLLALAIWRLATQRRHGITLVLLAMGILYLGSVPAVIHGAIRGLDRYPPLRVDALPISAPGTAIVVLGQGRQPDAVEYGGGDTVSAGGLARIRYAAWLHRKTSLPILTSGGTLGQATVSEADLMGNVLQQEFGVPVQWRETASVNTWENAQMSVAMLRRDGIHRILLVTHGIHMARSVWSFQRTGMEVIPAPTVLPARDWPASPTCWLPGVSGGFDALFHEYLGMLWYLLRYSWG